MRRTMIVGPIALAFYLACSGSGSDSDSRRPDPPTTPPVQDNSIRDVLLRLSNKRCGLRPDASNSRWVLDFKKASLNLKNFEIERVGTDFVRLTDGDGRVDLPFASIVFVTSDD